ncbi:TonB-linked SusC/RagA family outer membrane protein [Arcticibacter tournemirensis]|uniref:TonB-dependent receptor n=1 Tax=Arcticibacter tournemirensis TaxID=699437 RepID=A0A5M9HDZ7_9SPHI|nr:TonB-dependent receptor [Arcticibacter tournemirensis]KAA8484953.1 TonB-dependent receptor [Arcticibacter tournemirensis]TQM50606.1 TonB-linked SusC/RagA family outer membrane protein [Arcticibacter tournemirensis]
MNYTFTTKLRLIFKILFSALIIQAFIFSEVIAGQGSSLNARKKITVTGVVTANDGELLAGVNVLEKGTKNGTSTAINGKYTLVVEENATLVFTMIGFHVKEVPVKGLPKHDVRLVPDVTSLNEVMVVGYGSKNKSTFTGSAVTLNAEDLNKSSLSVANLLQGRAAGVQVNQNNGTPGAALSIRIRGTNSLNADSEPLYVIDGFPTNAGVGFSLNPEDIASMTILKDAASTAIYGSRGANGVILITTKNGINKESRLNIHSYLGVQNVVDRFDLIGPYDHALRLNKLSGLEGSLAPYGPGRLDSLQKGLLGTDWQDEAFRSASVQNHVVSFIGGSSKTAVFSSFDYLSQEGIIIHSQFKRYGGRVNVDHSVNDKFKMTARVFGNYGIQNDLPLSPSTINGFLKQVLKANPASTFDSGVPAQLDAQNPLHFLEAEDRENTTYRTNGYFSLKYQPVKNLTLQSDFGADITKAKVSYFAPSSVPNAVASKGIGTITNISEQDLIFNPTANYELKKNGHNAKFLLGYNHQNYTYQEEGINATNFSSDDLGYNNLGTAQQFTGYSGKTLVKRKSWFGRVDYDYKDKYIFTGTYRIDGSSVFGSNHKLGYFPSVAIAWRFNEESFIKDLGILSAGKARISYGVTGNDRISSGISLATYASDNSTKYTFDGVSTVSGIAVTRLSNADLKWEETAAWDFGLELGLLKNRVIFEADYYNKQTNDLLLDRSISPSTGFQTRFGNAGKVANKGIELSLQTVNMSSRQFKWNSTFSYSYNTNKVKALGTNNADIYVGSFKPDGAASFESPFIIRTGEPVGAIYGYVYDGIIQENDPVLTTTHPNAEAGDPKFVDLNMDGILDANDRKILGSGVPKSLIGLTNNITYKNFNLDIVLQGQTGGKLLNVQKIDLLNPVTQGNVLKEVLTDVWSPENTTGTIPARSFYGNSHGGWVNSRFVESSDFLRLKNITLTYNVPSSILKPVGIAGLDIYVNAQNLYTFTNYSGLDPEVGNLVNNSQQNRNVARGIDFNAYPVNRMYLLGARITF